MTWTKTNPTEQKQQFIDALRKRADNESFAALCEQFGISRETGYALSRAYKERGVAAFEPASRRPLNSPQAMSETVESRILELRAKHPTWGPRKLLASLEQRHPRTDWPVASSVGDLLRRRGLTHPRPRRHAAAPFSQPLGHGRSPNEVWCTDFKGWFRTLDGERCNPLTITDADSRMILRCTHVPQGTFGYVKPIFEAAFREFGLPLAMRSDNGTPFASTGVAGLSRLACWWIRLGIWPERIEPGCPEQNGRHERMHRTLKAEVANQPEANVRLQQRAFDRFRTEFNEERPHEALNQRPPATIYTPSPRNFPRRLPEIHYPSQALVRSVRTNGEIRFLGTTWFLGEALEGERVGLWETAYGWDVYFATILLARFDARTKQLVRNPMK